jgi:hypothetical protein
MSKESALAKSFNNCLTRVVLKETAFFLLAFFLLLPLPLFAQLSADYHSQFLQNYRQYQALVSPFQTKKSRYLAYKSVDTQEEFVAAARDLVRAEVEAITAYTNFVRTFLAEATQILAYQENYLYIKLDDELAFLTQSKSRANSISSLTEAQELLADLASHYQTIDQMSDQVKSIVAMESVKKTLENLKVERNKIDSYLQNQAPSARVSAAQEKLRFLDVEINATQELIGDMEKLNEKVGKSSSGKIMELADESLPRLNALQTGYANIVFSLK